MINFSFNLIDEPWIPCADLRGKYLKFGVRELIMRAHKLRSIQHPNPLTEAALLRILLALVHRSVDGPRNSREWKKLYQKGSFDERITLYLDKWRHRFDLFSSDAPFYQTLGLLVIDSSGKPVPQHITSIMFGVASGNNKTLFDHTTNKTSLKISPAEAAQVLVTAQMFSLQGLNRKSTNLFGYQQSFLNAAMVSGIFIVLSGQSLFDTLMLNLLIYDDVEPIPNTPDDCPVWERVDVGGTSATTPKGYLDFLTCKCRHLLLVPEQDGADVFVQHIHIAQGEAFPPKVYNPGFIRRRKKDGNWYHPQLDVNRLVWRDSNALFAFDEQSDLRPKAFHQVQSVKSLVNLPSRYICTAYALANAQANPMAWRREKLNIPLSLLTDRDIVAYLEKGMSISDKASGVLNTAIRTFIKEVLPENSKDVVEKTSATGAIQIYWDRLENHFQQFLLELDDPEKALETWETSVKRTVRE